MTELKPIIGYYSYTNRYAIKEKAYMKKLKKEIYQYVVIIGNGFDIDLDLPTRYSDFIESHHFKNLEIEGNELANHLRSTNDLQKWIDIEEELKNYSNKTDNHKKYLKEFKILCRALLDYVKEINYNDINRESTAYRLISEVFKAQNILILDFNYTDSIQEIMKELVDNEEEQIKSIEHVKLHGSSSEDWIIFGVEDNARIKKEHIFLKKSVNEKFNPVDFSSVIEKCDSAVFFGHSLGMTDHMYFKDFFRNAVRKRVEPRVGKERQSILLFYKGEEGYYNLLSEIDTMTMNKLKELKQINEFKMLEVKDKAQTANNAS